MEMTIKEYGAEGVYAAIADGMKAAAVSRELDAALEENRLLKAKNDALRNDNERKDKTIAMLEARCREDRRERQMAREAAWRYQCGNMKGQRDILADTVKVMIGMVLAFVVVSIILLVAKP